MKSIDWCKRWWTWFARTILEHVGGWGYSLRETEPRIPVYEYPSYDYMVTSQLTNLDLNDVTQDVEVARAAGAME